MTTTTTTEGTLLNLDPKRLVPDPDNPRGELRNIPDLANSISIFGVLEPITVRPILHDDGSDEVTGWIVVRGHRRLAATILAGLPAIPCQLENNDDARIRATTRLVENIQRDDFSPVEEARGIQQILDLGTPPETIAEDLGLSIEHVNQAFALGKSKVASSVTEKHGLNFDQAVALVEFQDDKEAVKVLTVTAVENPEDFPHTLSQVRQKRDEKILTDAATKEWTEKGYQVITSRPSWGDRSKVSRLSELAISKDKSKTKLTETNHTNCPGRTKLVAIGGRGNLVVEEFCTEWKKQGHVEPSGSGSGGTSRPKPQLSATEEQRLSTERKIHNAAMAAGRAAQVVRRDFVRDLIARKVAPAGTLKFAAEGLLSHQIIDSSIEFCELIGGKPAGKWDSAIQHQAKFVKGLPEKRLPLALFARLAAHIERGWATNSWKSPDDLRKTYLNFLISTGYTPALIEKVQLGKAKGEQVLDEADRLKATKVVQGVSAKTAVQTAAPPIPTTSKSSVAAAKTAVQTAAPRKAPTKAGPKGFRPVAKKRTAAVKKARALPGNGPALTK